MSSTSTPISCDRFAEAIRALPLSNLHLKAAELRNSIVHLETSNQQLKAWAGDDDAICSDAIRENLEVIRRMTERILLLKREVEQRGYLWEERRNTIKPEINGHIENNAHGESEQARPSNQRDASRQDTNIPDQVLAL